MTEQVIEVDKEGVPTGKLISKAFAHTGRGRRHLAISILLYNRRGEVLLQHRKHKIHNSIWDFTGSTHHLRKKDGSEETAQEATYRCLLREYGISKKIPLKILGGVSYFAQDGQLCENEYDIILTGEYDGKISPNKYVAYKYKWVDEQNFLDDVSENPKKYAPWVRLAMPLIQESEPSHFEKTLKKFLAIFEPYLKKYFKDKIESLDNYPPLIRKFYEDLFDFSASGKRLRAFLVWLGYYSGRVTKGQGDKVEERIKEILPIALAFEIIHSFLLIHDDIIDKSETRRNKPTIHKRYEKLAGAHYGISQAIIIGDIACFEAIRLINSSNFGDRIKRICLDKLTGVILETAYGEALDVENALSKKRNRISLGDIWQVTDLKTARYSFVGPLIIGAVLVGAGKKQIEALTGFGLSTGKAFQLQDDILGIFGNEKGLGKSTLSDMREGKNTLLIYKALAQANKGDKQKILKIWGSPITNKSDLEIIKGLIKKSGALEFCEKEKVKLANSAYKQIENISKANSLKLLYRGLVDFSVNRES